MAKKVWLISAIVVLAFVFSGPLLSQAQIVVDNGNKEELVMPNGRLIDLFHQGKWIISDEVQAYIEKCCEGRDEIVNLLIENKFQVKVKDVPNPEQYPKKYKQSIEQTGVMHDQVIIGKRSPGLHRFWRIFTKYKVYIYLQNKKGSIRISQRI